MSSKHDKESIDIGLRSAIDRLLRQDFYLLKKDVNERSISHRLGQYLQEIFTDWHVDCEYNRNHDSLKTLDLPPKDLASIFDTEAHTVYPDIIVHLRGTDQNLLVIEIKKSSSADAIGFDLQKLKAFRDELGYCYAVALRLRTGDNYGVDSLDYIDG